MKVGVWWRLSHFCYDEHFPVTEKIARLSNWWAMGRTEKWDNLCCRGELNWLDNISLRSDRWHRRSWKDWRLPISLLKRFMFTRSCVSWRLKRQSLGHKNQFPLLLSSTLNIRTSLQFQGRQSSRLTLRRPTLLPAGLRVKSCKDTHRRNSSSNTNLQQRSKSTPESTSTVWWGSRHSQLRTKTINSTTRLQHGLLSLQILIPTPKSTSSSPCCRSPISSRLLKSTMTWAVRTSNRLIRYSRV